jgi:hypothetical protein
MLMIQLLIGLLLMFGVGDAPRVAGLATSPESLGEQEVEYQRPPKDRQPQPVNVTWGELKGMYQ